MKYYKLVKKLRRSNLPNYVVGELYRGRIVPGVGLCVYFNDLRSDLVMDYIANEYFQEA